jgi:phage terminase small subunit
MKSKGLTPKQEIFVEQYLLTGNATQSAIKAGYSAKNAGKIGPELLGKTRIKDALKEHYDRRKAEFDVSEKKIVSELAQIAFIPFDIVTEKLEYGTTRGIKTTDKINALKLLGEHIGMWNGVRPGTDSNPLDVINGRLRARMAKRAATGRGRGGSGVSET